MDSKRIVRRLVLRAGQAASLAAPLAFFASVAGFAGAGLGQDAKFDLIALTGDPAPGLTDATFGRLSSPRLNEQGDLVLVSELEGPGVTEADSGALWAGTWRGPAGLSVVIRKGDPAPISAPGGEPVEFVAFPFPALNAGGVIGFTGSTADLAGGITGPDAIFIEAPFGGFDAVAEAFYPPEPGYFTSLPIAPLGADISSPFNADSQGWIGSASGLQRLLGQGDLATGTSPGLEVDFVDLPQISAGRMAAVAMRASVGDPAERFDRHQTLWRRASGMGGAVELVAWADPREPGPGELLFADFGVAPWIDRDGDTVFWASVRGDSVTELNDAAVWSASGGGLAQIVREGNPAPGLGADVVIGKLSRQVAINDFGQMALMTSLVGMVSTDDNTAILATGAGGGLEVVVREGDQAPGASAGAVFHSLSDPAINHAGQVAFLAQLRGGGLELDEKFALYATDRQGLVHEIVRTGTLFDVRGDGTDLREVRQIEFASDPGRTGHSQFAFDGSLAVLITFEDWNSGIYVASVGCLGDADGDGELTFFDFLAFQDWFGAGDPRADLDADGAFTFFDFLAFQDAFGAGCD
jgi:hypothetical protein